MPSTHTRDDGGSDLLPPPLEPAAVTTQAERSLAGGHWLLPSAPLMSDANADWKNKGAAWLRPGMLFGAVVVQESVIHAAVGLEGPAACAPHLVEALEGGPVFYRPDGFGPEGAYTALVPASAALQWQAYGSLAHPYRALLQIPAPDQIAPDDEAPWWVVPLDGPGLLCPPERLAALVAVGHRALSRRGGDTGA